MSNMIIRRVTVGFGFTSLPANPGGGGKVMKYYFEPEVEFEVPAVSSESEIQETLDKMCSELTTMVQKAVQKKVASDKQQMEKKTSDV